jgi:hypothetical protein
MFYYYIIYNIIKYNNFIKINLKIIIKGFIERVFYAFKKIRSYNSYYY